MRRFHLITFGCQMNQHDSDRIRDVLEGAGYRPAEGVEAADLVLLNTCSVREKAEQKLRSEVGRLGLLKRARPHLVIGVAGCVAQQEGERLVKKLPQIDLVVGPDQASELPRLLEELEQGGLPQVRTVFDTDAPRFLPSRPAPGRSKVSDFVTIMKGCDERCTFCIVPTTRGPERYRPSSEVVSEVARLVAAGTREVTLLGQTVDSYIDPSAELGAAEPDELQPALRGSAVRRDASQFPSLLRRIAAEVPGLARLRYTSPHPRHLTRALIDAHRDLSVLARHVHMPVQSGSDRVLRRMLRRYTVSEYRERVSALQHAVPGLTLSTDVIVGFPGETGEDFAQTLELIEAVGFAGVFAFKYSPRPFTPALKLGDDVPEEVKAERLARLFELSEALLARHLESLVGTAQAVLIEGAGQRGGYTGRTLRNEIVHVPAARDVTGELIEVRILRAFKHSLEAEPCAPELIATAQPLDVTAQPLDVTAQPLGPTAAQPPQATAPRRPRALPILSGA